MQDQDVPPALHDAQTEGDDLRGEEEVDDLLLVRLDEGPNHPERGEPEVLEGPGLRDGVEEGVEVEGDVGQEEGGPGVGVAGHTLQQGQGVTHPVALVGGEDGRVDGGVDVDDLLEQGGHGAEAVPEHGGEVRDDLPLLGEL